MTLEFTPAGMSRAQLEQAVEKARVLARLTADYLFLLGHRRNQAANVRMQSNPARAAATLKNLDVQLGEMETLLGLDAPSMQAPISARDQFMERAEEIISFFDDPTISDPENGT